MPAPLHAVDDDGLALADRVDRGRAPADGSTGHGALDAVGHGADHGPADGRAHLHVGVDVAALSRDVLTRHEVRLVLPRVAAVDDGAVFRAGGEAAAEGHGDGRQDGRTDEVMHGGLPVVALRQRTRGGMNRG